MDKSKSAGKLTVRINDPSISAFESAIEHLPQTSEGPSGARLAAVADVISNAGNAADSPLVGSFTSLMQSLNVLVQIGDEIAKACSRCIRIAPYWSHLFADTPLGKPCMERTFSWF